MRRRREKKETLDLDITSLLDVLVILLVFLLKSYNASDLTVSPKEDIVIPLSKSEKLGEYAVIVQVSKTGKVWVDNDLLSEADAFMKSNVDPTDGKMISLHRRLVEKFEEAKDLKHQKLINLVMDQDLEYDKIQKVMHTAGLVGHSKFKFVVQADF